jgi:hypothetical protein
MTTQQSNAPWAYAASPFCWDAQMWKLQVDRILLLPIDSKTPQSLHMMQGVGRFATRSKY